MTDWAVWVPARVDGTPNPATPVGGLASGRASYLAHVDIFLSSQNLFPLEKSL
jgi:hypothetical protein